MSAGMLTVESNNRDTLAILRLRFVNDFVTFGHSIHSKYIAVSTGLRVNTKH